MAMKTFNHRGRSKPNASLISIVQRFTDISIIFVGLYASCLINNKYFGYNQILVCLIVLSAFQMIGGISDFYRSWRGVKLSVELSLVLKNWTLSLLLSMGITTYSEVLGLSFKIMLEWYFFVCLGVVICRMSIRAGARFIRTLGYNTRRIAIAGSMPVAINLAKSFIDEPWLGFVVVGIYDNKIVKNNEIEYKGDFNKLIVDAKAGELDRIYLAMSMSDEIEMRELIRNLTNTTCSVILIPDIFTFNILQSRTEEVNGVPG